MSILKEIIAHKRGEVARLKEEKPLREFRDYPLYSRTPLSLSDALRGKNMAVIAEVKKASPSQKVIRKDFEPVALARELAAAGACALSVLTDRTFFEGDIGFILSIRPEVALPILRKDFIVDEYQIHEAKAAGADAVLLILAALEKDAIPALLKCAADLGLETLIEVHGPEEVKELHWKPGQLIGINNRDLTTFEVDLSTTFRVQKAVPTDALLVSESGIRNASDLKELLRHGIHAALIGESLMREQSPGTALRHLLSSLEEEPW